MISNDCLPSLAAFVKEKGSASDQSASTIGCLLNFQLNPHLQINKVTTVTCIQKMIMTSHVMLI